MSTLAQRYHDYVEHAKARGAKFISYNCPHCQGVIETREAPKGDAWDTLSNCPHCDDTYWKITRGSIVEAYKLEEA